MSNSKTLTIQQRLSSEVFASEIAKVLPRHMTPERMVRVALTALRRTPKLSECSQESFFKCMLDLSAWGLEPDGRRAHLIPYGKECTLIIDYKGLVELAMRSGRICSIHSDIVCENDEFVFDRGSVVKHQIDFRAKRGEVYAVYCIVKFKDGAEKCEAMSREEVEEVRKRSKAGRSGPWVTDWNEMAKKTVFRRCSKWLTLEAEQMDAFYGDHDLIDTRKTIESTNMTAESILAALPSTSEHAEPSRKHSLDVDCETAISDLSEAEESPSA